MTRPYELHLASGARELVSAETGYAATTRYECEHPGARVLSFRVYRGWAERTRGKGVGK